MKISQVAAQLYTVRAFCQTATALAGSARKLRAIGYPAVQVSGVGPIAPAEIRRIMDGEGLAICATHEPDAMILNDPDRAIANLQAIGCTLTAYPYPNGVDFTSAAAIAAWARKLDAAGARFRAAGLTLGYHNHDIEFCRFNEETILDFVFAHTDPQNLVSELDTYWVQAGGGDCVAWCRKLRGRLPFIHLKDYGVTLARQPEFREIGRGTLPFAAIIAEAEQSGCAWFIVEQDTCPGDPFDSLKLSFEHLKAHLAA